MLEYAQQMGNVRKACRYFGIGRSGFYRWRRAFERNGETGLVNRRPVARFHPKTRRPEVVEQVLHLRRTYHLGPARIVWDLARDHEFQALFHWHLADHGIRHVYIKARTPQLNGKVERSHRADQQEFYQLLSHKGDVDPVSGEIRYITLPIRRR